jgi:MFS family permease
MMTLAQPSRTADTPSLSRAWFTVAALSLASIISYIDRQVINLLVDPIKADLGISDVQISLLQGFSFALLYALLAIPLAWIADRHNRKTVILIGLICWTAATFSSGLAAGFAMLFVARMMVGLGEATLAPAGLSMISDYFSKERLPAATGVFVGSGFIGSGLALIIGGYIYSGLETRGELVLPIGTFAPWQQTFMAVAFLSVPLMVILMMVREPARREGNLVLAADDAPPALEIVEFLRTHARVFFPLFFGFSCFSAAQFGISAWAPSYFIRVHEWSQIDVGTYFGPVVMVAGTTGVVAGGVVAERLLAKGVSDATLRVPLIAIGLALPLSIAFPLASSPGIALALLALVILLGTVPFGAGVSTFPLITPNRMRAQVVAVYLLIANLLGFSAGPVLIAAITDNVFADPTAIGSSLALAVPATLILGLVLVAYALIPYRAMIARNIELETSHAAY